MKNLLEETVNVLSKFEKSTSDVRWIGGKGFIGDWADFESIANFEYDNGYGGNEIDSTLKIVGDDWWLERGEYDGSEWWEFKILPNKIDYAQVNEFTLTERW